MLNFRSFTFLLRAFIACCFFISSQAMALPSGFTLDQNVNGPWQNQPIALAFAPDGRLFVCERAGRVIVIDTENNRAVSTFHALNGVNTDVERGLLGIAFDPNFNSNRYLYLFYISNGLENRLVRIRASSSNANISDGSEQVIFRFPGGQYGNHNGGAIKFGPDSMLYLATGDQGAYFGADSPQRIDNLYGKIIRLNVSNYPGSIIPSSNPYVGQAGARGEIWAIGHRNPFTFDIDPSNGRVFVSDVGDSIEKIYQASAGSNGGWPSCFDSAEQWRTSCNTSAYNPPFHTYDHSDGSVSISGGAFYRAGVFPSQYNGAYFFTDWGSAWIKYVTPDLRVHTFATAAEAPHTFGPVNMAVGSDGALYVVDLQGPVNRYRYTGGSGGNRPPLPAISANPASGTAPLNVQFSGSATVDPDGDAISSYRWNFGDGSAEASGVNVSHTYSSAGTFTARLTVQDSRGASASTSRAVTVNSAVSPVLSITSPSAGTRYRAGDTIMFSGSITHPTQGAYPAEAYEWEIQFGHDNHFHPFFGPQQGITQGSVTLSSGGHPEVNVYYRFILRLRPEFGTADPVIRDLSPVIGEFTVDTEPPGLQVSVDGRPHEGSLSFSGVVGVTREISAPEAQTYNGRVFDFISWSDGGQLTHLISTPRIGDYLYRSISRENSDNAAAVWRSAVRPHTIFSSRQRQ